MRTARNNAMFLSIWFSVSVVCASSSIPSGVSSSGPALPSVVSAAQTSAEPMLGIHRPSEPPALSGLTPADFHPPLGGSTEGLSDPPPPPPPAATPKPCIKPSHAFTDNLRNLARALAPLIRSSLR